MQNLKDFYVANAVKIEIQEKRLRRYKELGMVLIDYSGKDQINPNTKYVMLNGNISPKELNYFEIISSESIFTYLHNLERFDEFLKRIKPDEGLRLFYVESLLSSQVLDIETIKAAFKIMSPNCYELGYVKKMHYVRNSKY